MSHITGGGERQAAIGLLAREGAEAACQATAPSPLGATPPYAYNQSSGSQLIHITRTLRARRSERGPARDVFPAHVVLPVHVAA